MTEAQKASTTKVRETADALRDEAKRLLCSAIGLPEDVSSDAIDRAVDCIINAAVLEAMILIQQGDKEN